MGAYKLTCLLVGLVLSYFGYKLFLAGVWGNAGDLNVKFKNNEVVLKSAAPGTFFVLFGTIVIALTILEPVGVSYTEGSKDTEVVSAAPTRPDKKPDFN